MNGSDVILVGAFFTVWYALACRRELRAAWIVGREWAGMLLLILGYAAGTLFAIIDEYFEGATHDEYRNYR